MQCYQEALAMTPATARKTSLGNEHRPNRDYFRLFHLVGSLYCWQSTLQVDWCARQIIRDLWFNAQVVIKTVNEVISRCCFAEDGTDLFIGAFRTCSHLFSLARPIKFLICGVVVAVPVMDAKAPYCFFRNETFNLNLNQTMNHKQW